MSRYTVILALPQGKDSDGLAQALIDHANALPEMMRSSLTWDQGSEMARHAALTLASDLPVYFADPHSPWQRPSNENTYWSRMAGPGRLRRERLRWCAAG